MSLHRPGADAGATSETQRTDIPPATATSEASSITRASSGRKDRAFAKACQAIDRHGTMFEAAGAELLRFGEGPEGEQIVLCDDEVTFHLRYRVRRKLLARIYHLQICFEVPCPSLREVPEYKVELHRKGLVDSSFYLAETGQESEEGEVVAAALTRSGLVEELASNVDLDRFSVTWSPQTSNWEVIVEPYPGSHLFKVFPPISYTVWLQEQEVRAILAFLRSMDMFFVEQLASYGRGHEKGDAVEHNER